MQLILGLLLVFFGINVSAQEENSEVIEVANLSGQEVHPEEYTVSNQTAIVVNGRPFIQIDLTPKATLPLNCQNNPIVLNRALLLANLASATAAGIGVLKIAPKQDKLRHALAGYVVGNVTTGTLQLILPLEMKYRKLAAMAGGFGASVLVGIGKEVWDSQGHGHVESKDAIVTGLGGLGGSLTISFGDAAKAFKKKQKQPTF